MTQSVRELAFQTIQEIFNDYAYSNLRINEVLSTGDVSDIDKPLYTELVYDCKEKNDIDFYLRPFVKTK